MHRSLVHAQAVARAADRIAHELDLAKRDDVLAVALLHDVGKLAMGRSIADYPTDAERGVQPRGARAPGTSRLGDGPRQSRWHPAAAVGPAQASCRRGPAAHHSAEAEARACHLRPACRHGRPPRAGRSRRRRQDAQPVPALRPLRRRAAEPSCSSCRTGRSRRRRAEPSPLSNRETTIVRLLAEGKRYKEIALDLGVAASTVRTHLHNVYAKIGVDDRAQAVLRVTEMGWI